MRLKEGQDPIVEHVGGDQSVLAVVELGAGELRVGIDEGLLIDAAHPFEGSNIERILGSQIAGMLGFDLAMGFFLVPGPLQGDDLALSEGDQAVLSDLGFQGLQTQLEGLQVMAEPDAANAAGRDEEALLMQLIGDADLTPGGLVEGELNHGLFDLRGDSVLEDGLPLGDLPKGFFVAGFIEFLEAVEAISGVAQDLAGLGDVAQLSSLFDQAHFVLDDLL